MARSDLDLTVTQSVLERLTDRDPKTASDPAMARAQSIRLMKASLRRDLEWLLNTRRTPEPAPDSMAELSHSLFNYGLPDFAALSLHSPKDRDRLLIELEDTVTLFEPRLRNVRVSLVDPSSAGVTRTLQFQIEALLHMDPTPEQVSFDAVLQLTSGEYQIRGDRGA